MRAEPFRDLKQSEASLKSTFVVVVVVFHLGTSVGYTETV